MIKGRYRFRLLVKSLRNVDLSEYLREWLAAGAEDQGQSQARGRRRSAELPVSLPAKAVAPISLAKIFMAQCERPLPVARTDMTSLRNRIIPPLSAFLTSRARRDAVRNVHALRRRLNGATPTVRYFHQVDDPYSHLAAQMLVPLMTRYGIALEVYLVPSPDDAAAPERQRLQAYGLRDAVRLARAYGLEFPPGARLPSPETTMLATRRLAANPEPQAFAARAQAIGAALWTGGDVDPDGAVRPEVAAKILERGRVLREKLGHYLGGMFQFEGEWYWGVDRLNHLEQRLRELGLDRAAAKTPSLAPYRTMRLDREAAPGPAPVIEFWFSFRSPYVSIAFPRVRQLARHYGAELRLRPILPMIMRGLPVPRSKTRYIMLDAMREAERSGMAYGRMIEPVGAPGGALHGRAVSGDGARQGRGLRRTGAEIDLRRGPLAGRGRRAVRHRTSGRPHRRGCARRPRRRQLARAGRSQPPGAAGGGPVGCTDLSGERQAGALGPGPAVGAGRGYRLKCRQEKACRHG